MQVDKRSKWSILVFAGGYVLWQEVRGMPLTNKELSKKAISQIAAIAAGGKNELTSKEMAQILDGYRDLLGPFLKDWSLPGLPFWTSGQVTAEDTVIKVGRPGVDSMYDSGIFNAPYGPNEDRIQHYWGLTCGRKWYRVVVEYGEDMFHIMKITIRSVTAEELLQGFDLWEIISVLRANIDRMTGRRESLYMDALSLQMAFKMATEMLAELPASEGKPVLAD